MSESDQPKRRLRGVKEACKYGGFGRTKAYELMTAGKIDAYKMDQKTVIDLNSVDRYIESLPKFAPGSDHH